MTVAVKWALNNNNFLGNGHLGREDEGGRDGVAGNFIIKKSWDILRVIEEQDTLFRKAAESLYLLHDKLQRIQEPIYDISTAVDVLTLGSYERLPISIHNQIPTKQDNNEEGRESVMNKLDRMIHLRLFSTQVPPEFTEAFVEGGCAVCGVSKEFRVYITIEHEEGPWTMSKLDIFVAPDTSLTESSNFKYENFPEQVKKVSAIAQEKITNSEQPLFELYEVIHSFCRSLQLYILFNQSIQLAKNQPTLNMTPEFSEGRILVKYWVPPAQTIEPHSNNNKKEEPPKNPPPVLEIFTENSNLSVRHVPTITDTDNEPIKLQLQPSDALNFESLLQRAISSFIKSKLCRAYDSLRPPTNASGFDFRSRSKLLPSEDDPEQLYLKVDLIENSSLFVKVDERSGLFSLKVEPPSFEEEFLRLLEDRVNTIDVSEIKTVVRVSLNRKMIEYYEHAAFSARLIPSRRLPKRGLVPNSNFTDSALYIRFPSPHQDHFIVVEIGDVFQQKFFLIHTKVNEGFLDIDRVEAITERGRNDSGVEMRTLPLSSCYQILERNAST